MLKRDKKPTMILGLIGTSDHEDEYYLYENCHATSNSFHGCSDKIPLRESSRPCDYQILIESMHLGVKRTREKDEILFLLYDSLILLDTLIHFLYYVAWVQ